MAENNQRFNIQELADKWAQGKLSPEEKAYLEQWYAGFNDENITLTDSDHENSEALRKAMLSRINTQIQKEEKPVRRLITLGRIVAAASVLFVLGIGAYQIFIKPKPVQLTQVQPHDISPGKNQATLTLANGQKIILTKNLKGNIARQGNIQIQAGTGNAITYAAMNKQNNEVAYNTLTTANGEISPYPLILSDGTKIWLNAGSSVTFPIAFTKNEREIKITGEAYFEVTHNPSKPFRVISATQTVEVLGTHFDVNSYADEPSTRTTLLEGKVRVTIKDKQSAILAPGQQSINTNTKINITTADIEATMAWKEGMFRFSTENLESIMLQVSRWYDVKVVYQDDSLKSKRFSAITTRFSNISQLLHDLELTGEIKFKIDGKKITVFHN